MVTKVIAGRAETRGVMGINIWQGKGGLSEGQISMATPDASEAKDLVVHVERCAKRFRLLAEAQNDVHADVNQIKNILIGVGGYLVIVSQPAQNMISSLLKLFAG